jgi:hypothetical protein
MMADPAVLELLREISDKLSRLCVLAETGRGALAPADRSKLQNLLPAIYAAVGELSFTVASLDEHVQLYGASDLGDALATCGSARSIGKLLRRGSGCGVNGLHLQRQGHNGGANIYALKKGSETF